jgi:two-component system sensor histidine kinase/response regulator
MDMRMPEMDGYEATRKIRVLEGSAAHTVIVALTASAFDEQKATIFAAGCDDFVSKPFKAHVIFDKLAEHLGVQYLYEPEIKSPLLQERVKDLNPASIQIMSSDWIAELQQAALKADRDRILQLIEQIPANDSEVAQQLTELVQQFEFDEILALTETDNY